MSQRTRAHRPAVLCSKATGTRYRKCLAWEEAGLISFRQPVPDALSPEQRPFEAMIALVLAEALCDRQLDGALLGFHRVEPAPDGVSLYPHPAMADRVISELLPRLDDEYWSELRGVPGLRARWHQGTIVLYDLATSAQVHVIWPRCTRQSQPILNHQAARYGIATGWMRKKRPVEPAGRGRLTTIRDGHWWPRKQSGIGC